VNKGNNRKSTLSSGISSKHSIATVPLPDNDWTVSLIIGLRLFYEAYSKAYS
jgi:hypothetical protein